MSKNILWHAAVILVAATPATTAECFASCDVETFSSSSSLSSEDSDFGQLDDDEQDERD